jgi:hypothetical protein
MAAERGTVQLHGAGQPGVAGLRRHGLPRLVHQHDGGLVLHVEITGKLHGRQALGRVHDQADRGQQVDAGQLARGEDRPRGDAELAMAGGAFAPTPRGEIVDIEAAASRTDRLAAGLRPPQGAGPAISSLLALGIDAPERQRACRSREEETLRHPTTSRVLARECSYCVPSAVRWQRAIGWSNKLVISVTWAFHGASAA